MEMESARAVPLIIIPDGIRGESLIMTREDARLLQLELRGIQQVLITIREVLER